MTDRRGFESPLLGDEEGRFMANYAAAARHVAGRLAGRTVLELCCGIGGTTVELAAACPLVYAVDRSAGRLRYAALNLESRGLLDRVTLVEADALDPALLSRLRAGAVYADPDWSAPGTAKDRHVTDPALMQPPADRLLEALREAGHTDVVLRLPALVPEAALRAWGPCEVETPVIDGKQMRFVHAYFGGLARVEGRTEAVLRSASVQ